MVELLAGGRFWGKCGRRLVEQSSFCYWWKTGARSAEIKTTKTIAETAKIIQTGQTGIRIFFYCRGYFEVF